jgi:predicted nucleic acid-binding protein
LSAIFLDSNVILYTLSADTIKADRAEAILSEGGTISVQVLNEIVSVCSRKLAMPWEEIDYLLDAVKATCMIVPLTLESHEKAVAIARRYKISFYDAHICAAAVLNGASTLFSEDMQDGMLIDGLTIKNPFQ